MCGGEERSIASVLRPRTRAPRPHHRARRHRARPRQPVLARAAAPITDIARRTGRQIARDARRSHQPPREAEQNDEAEEDEAVRDQVRAREVLEEEEEEKGGRPR